MQYQSITNVTSTGKLKDSWTITAKQTCWPELSSFGQSTSATSTATCDPPTAPTSVLKSAPDLIVNEWKVPKKDKSSFKKIVQSGTIKMTNYSVGRITVKHHVVRVPAWSANVGLWSLGTVEGGSYGVWWSYNGVRCNETRMQNQPPLIARTDWIQNVSLNDLNSLPHYNLTNDINDQVATSIEQVKSDVVSSLMRKYDLMTDLFETRSTAETARKILKSAISPLKTASFVLKTLKSAGASHKEITSKWLELRYGIMPILFSAIDLAEMWDKRESKYQTERSRDTITCPFPELNLPEASCTYTVLRGSYKINATGKAKFSTPSARLLHQTGLNIITSTVEVIPYSLVLNWFTNFSDYLTAQTSGLNEVSTEMSFCYSVKQELDTEVWWQRKYSESLSVNGWPSMGFSRTSYQQYLMKSTTETSYRRVVFQPSDVQFILNPMFGNWKRWADAYALSINPLKSLLRSFK